MNVFITGGAGFIGSHLCDRLVAEGHDVTVLDNLSTGSIRNLAHINKKIKVLRGDIRDENLVENLTKNSDLVLHLAAAVGVENIIKNPIESISINFHGSEVVLNSAAKFDKRILIASTSEIYGKNEKQPLFENHDRVIGAPQKYRWSYSDAKALEEAMAFYLFISQNLKTTTVRLFNTVGPRQSGKYGMVIPRFIKAALNNEPLVIYGDGTQSRVFCHVLDVVDAIWSLTNTNLPQGEVYNIGGLEEISITELANKIVEKTNSKSKIIYKSYIEVFGFGYEDMRRRVPAISKIKKATGWSPKKNLDNIIEDTINIFL